MIKAIIFDCFGVLYQDPIEYMKQSRQFRVDELQTIDDFTKQLDLGIMSEAVFVSEMATLTGLSEEDIRGNLAGKVRNLELLEKIKQLHREFKIALLTNATEETIARLFNEDECRILFHTMVVSSQVRMIKPSAEIFRYTCDQLNEEPHYVLMVDDNYMNIEGARQAGLQVIQFMNNRQLINDLETIIGVSARTLLE